jgi:hypothetical protein
MFFMVFLRLVREVFMWYVKLGHNSQDRERWWVAVHVLMRL